MEIRFKEENLEPCDNIEAPYPPVVALGEILDYLDRKLSFKRADQTEILVHCRKAGRTSTSCCKQWQQITESWMAYRIEKGMGNYIEKYWKTRDIFRCHFELEVTHVEKAD